MNLVRGLPMAELRLIRIFLSSPGDVADERGIARKVIEDLGVDPLLRDKVVVRSIAWDTPSSRTPMLATLTPQEAINRRIAKPSECDIVVVLFWSRMGTPLPCPEYQKPDGSPFHSGTEWEYLDAVQGANTRPDGLPLVVVYRRTEPVMLTIDDPDFERKREQFRLVEAFFDQFDRPDGSISGGYNSYETPDEFRQLFEIDVKELVDTALKARTVDMREPETDLHEDMPKQKLWQGSPFPGLRAFTPDDAPIFFGRGRETDELIRKVAENRFVAVVGASGSGKSSLVAAGLLPRLAANAISGEGVGSKDWHVVSFKPGGAGGNPFEALYDALVKTFPALRPQPLEASRQKREFLTELGRNPAAIADTCQAALAEEPDWAEVLLFIDQFEETFTQVSDATVRRAFVGMVETVVQTARMRVVLTLRADFYYRCVEFPVLAQLLRTGNFTLAAPGERALEEMITRPVERAGLCWKDDSLPERILEDTGQEPGALPLMAYTLDELYKSCCQDNGGTLSVSAYEDLGGVRGAIGTRAENVFEEQDKAAQDALPRIFRELVDVDERGTFTRKRAPLAHVTDTPTKERLVRALTEARLLMHSRGEEDQPIVEVAHEALLQHWGRLADWLEEAREDLIVLKNVREDAAAWIGRGRQPDDDGLYRGAVLEEKLGWVERNDLRQDRQTFRDELMFIEASRQHEIRVAGQERLRRRRYQLAWAGFTVALIALVAYFYWRNQALETDKIVLEVRQERVATLAAGDVGFVPFGEGLSNQEIFGTATKVAELNAWDKENPVIDEVYKEQYGIEMVQVPAGCFWMGSVSTGSDERPVHEVCFEEPFWIDRFQVTNEQFERLEGKAESGSIWSRSEQPRTNVTWFEARHFCEERRGAQLPTEAQWEYAARGPDSLVYPWGNEFFADNVIFDTTEPADVGEVQRPDGVSWIGAYDMSGNVMEWMADWYDRDFYQELEGITVVDPQGPENGGGRVLRGSAFDDYLSIALRSASRTTTGPPPHDKNVDVGFRCVRLD